MNIEIPRFAFELGAIHVIELYTLHDQNSPNRLTRLVDEKLAEKQRVTLIPR